MFLGPTEVSDAREVEQNWEALKLTEKDRGQKGS